MKEKVELPQNLVDHLPWTSDANPIWPASSFVLQRNMAKRHFPSKLSEAGFGQTLELLKSALLSSSELAHPTAILAEEIHPTDKEFLFEHFLCMDSFQHTLSGQAFIVDETSKFLSLINIQDHLHLQIIDCKADWQASWNRLTKLENDIGNKIEYAYSPRFGYLTSDPAACGTGLIVSLYLHVPALIHTGQLQEALLKQKEEDVLALGFQGSIDELVGDFIILRNRYTLGLSEENIFHALHATAMKLMLTEKTIRTHLQQENNTDIKDKISRAYGLLIHSYQLQTKEALNALSMMKLGVDLGWISGINDHQINEIFFKCRRAHLCHQFKDKAIDQQDIGRKRADFVKQALKDAVFNRPLA